VINIWARGYSVAIEWQVRYCQIRSGPCNLSIRLRVTISELQDLSVVIGYIHPILFLIFEE
jgi:hypothetical protein